ncbi:RHS repeat domain-containing protein [Massilia sp. YIM B04103]|uniref:RHS repeat domain-containing protein n=1 Tax=Massilia sp. YIM B04103 TaxID=2963106 RepID=UPI0021094640|nr:RHS repeat domain-containing protein [Massilia sp. YIM B04103]
MKAVLLAGKAGHWRKLAVASLAALAASAAFAGSATYTYDSLGRVSKIVYSNGVVITYTYDAAGNRSTYVVTGAPS